MKTSLHTLQSLQLALAQEPVNTRGTGGALAYELWSNAESILADLVTLGEIEAKLGPWDGVERRKHPTLSSWCMEEAPDGPDKDAALALAALAVRSRVETCAGVPQGRADYQDEPDVGMPVAATAGTAAARASELAPTTHLGVNVQGASGEAAN